MKKFVSVLLVSGLILSLAGCSSNINESIANEQTNTTVSEVVSETNAETDSENTVATSTDTVTIDGWEYSLEGMSDEEVADLVFNTINSFHYGLSIDEWYSIVGVIPATISDNRTLDYQCIGYNMGSYLSEDYVNAVELQYILVDDNGIIQPSSNDDIAQVEISIRIVDTERAQNIYNILKAKFAEVTDVAYHEDEDQDDYWQTYASIETYEQAWRVRWSSSNEESLQLHADGMSENSIIVQAWTHAYPGMES